MFQNNIIIAFQLSEYLCKDVIDIVMDYKKDLEAVCHNLCGDPEAYGRCVYCDNYYCMTCSITCWHTNQKRFMCNECNIYHNKCQVSIPCKIERDMRKHWIEKYGIVK